VPFLGTFAAAARRAPLPRDRHRERHDNYILTKMEPAADFEDALPTRARPRGADPPATWTASTPREVAVLASFRRRSVRTAEIETRGLRRSVPRTSRYARLARDRVASRGRGPPEVEAFVGPAFMARQASRIDGVENISLSNHPPTCSTAGQARDR
jgi:hypothetical protein